MSIESQQRSAQRLKRIRWTTASHFLDRGAAALLMFLTVKLPIGYLGVDRFGIWMTIAGFTTMLSFLDLGMGNALTNQVARSNSEEDHEKLSKVISHGLLVLGGVGLIELLALLLLVPVVPWSQLFGQMDSAQLTEIRWAAVIFACCFGVNQFYSGLVRIYAGLQEGYIGHLAAFSGYVLACGCLLMASQYKASISMLILATFGAQMCGIVPMLYLLCRRRLFRLGISRKQISNAVRSLLGTGKYFLAVQVALMFNWGADSIIISSILGPSSVAIYSVMQKMFLFVSQPVAMLNGPLWPAYTDAYAKNDDEFVGHVLKKTVRVTVLYTSAAGIFLIAFGSDLGRLWTSGDVSLPITLVAAYACWVLCDNLNLVCTMVLYAKNQARVQAIGTVVFSVIALSLKIVLLKHFGLTVFPVAMVFAFIVACFVGYVVYKSGQSEYA